MSGTSRKHVYCALGVRAVYARTVITLARGLTCSFVGGVPVRRRHACSSAACLLFWRLSYTCRRHLESEPRIHRHVSYVHGFRELTTFTRCTSAR